MDGSIPKHFLSLCWDRLSMGERMVLVSNKIEFSEQSCIGKGFPQDNILTLTEANKTEKQECNNILKISTHLIYLQIQIKLVWSLPKIDHLFSFICLLCKSDTDMSRCLAKCLFVPGWLWGLLYLAGQPYAPNVYSNIVRVPNLYFGSRLGAQYPKNSKIFLWLLPQPSFGDALV